MRAVFICENTIIIPKSGYSRKIPNDKYIIRPLLFFFAAEKWLLRN